MLNLDNLESIIQSKVDALGPTATEKDLLLLSKAIESAVGNITVSKICERGAIALVDIEAARQASIDDIGAAGTAEIEMVNTAGDQKIAAIGALDAVPKSGGTMTGPLTGTTITADTVTAGQINAAGATLTGDLKAANLFAGGHVAEGVNPLHSWHETDAPANNKRWDAIALNGVLTHRVVDDVYGAVKSWMEVCRTAVSAVWVRFTTAVQGSIVAVAPLNNTFTVDARLGNSFDLGTITAASTLANLTYPPAAGFEQQISVRWTQDATGGRTMSFGGNCINIGGTVANLLPGKTTYAVGKLYSDGKFYYSLVRQP